jgi:hypothetical protein
MALDSCRVVRDLLHRHQHLHLGAPLLWFDEILTALISRLPSARAMLRALTEIEEQTPPL